MLYGHHSLEVFSPSVGKLTILRSALGGLSLELDRSALPRRIAEAVFQLKSLDLLCHLQVINLLKLQAKLSEARH